MNVNNFLEEFMTGIKDDFWSSGKEKYYEIFVNPSKDELIKLAKKRNGRIRYLIDWNKRKIYVFDAGLLHHVAGRAIKDFVVKDPSSKGQGIVEGGIIIHDFEKLRKRSWLKKYFGDYY